MWSHISTSPRSSAAATSFWPSASDGASGFSTSTCLPASRQASTTSVWVAAGVATATATITNSILGTTFFTLTGTHDTQVAGGGLGASRRAR